MSQAGAGGGETELQQRLGYHFARTEYLQLALTHRSWWREQTPAAGPADNERLEFLGDAVVGLRVSERLYAAFPTSSEGQLSRLRAGLVSARHLALVARRLGLGDFLRLSHAEEAIGGRSKQRLLANGLEALLGAIHLDGGFAAAAEVVDRCVVGSELDQLSPDHLHEFGYKSALQEWAHAHGHGLPIYRLLSATGPEHTKHFVVEVSVAGVRRGQGSGSSKKEAEQRAAEAALNALEPQPPGPPDQ